MRLSSPTSASARRRGVTHTAPGPRGRSKRDARAGCPPVGTRPQGGCGEPASRAAAARSPAGQARLSSPASQATVRSRSAIVVNATATTTPPHEPAHPTTTRAVQPPTAFVLSGAASPTGGQTGCCTRSTSAASQPPRSPAGRKNSTVADISSRFSPRRASDRRRPWLALAQANRPPR